MVQNGDGDRYPKSGVERMIYMIIVAIFWAMFVAPLLLALVAGSVITHRRGEAANASPLLPRFVRVVSTTRTATDPTFGWRQWSFGGGRPPAATPPVVDGGSISWGWDGVSPVRVDWMAFEKAIRQSTPPRGICSPAWESTAGATTPARPISMDRETISMVSRSGRKPGRALAHREMWVR